MKKKMVVHSEHSLKDLTSVSRTVFPLAKQLLGEKGLLELEILRHWSQIVGDDMAQYSLPQKITFRKDKKTEGCLYIQVLSGAFAMEINQNGTKIIEKINFFFGYPAVSSLKIIQNTHEESFLLKKKNTVNVKKTLVSEQEEIYITELIGDIKSPQLRETVEKLGRAVFSDHPKQE